MADPTAARARPHMRGVYPVLVTPFDEHGEVDLAGLERCVAFCLEAGAHGVVALVNASEFTTLSDAERSRIADRVVRAVAGQVPVVLGVSAGTARLAAGYAVGARTAGADAVIAMPPFVRAASRPQVRDYFRAIAVAAGLPVFIQNYHGYPGAQLTVDAVAELVCSIEGVSYVKEEVLPAGQRMSELIERAGATLDGVMGGLAGRFMIDEFARGACGTMPACEITDVHVAIWQALEAGDVERARAIHARALPLLTMEWLYGAPVYKEVLRRRGIIVHASVREPGAAVLDARDHHELDALLELLQDDLRRPSADAASRMPERVQ